MSLFDEIRQAAPWAKDLTDRQIIDKGVELTGLSPMEVAGYLGVSEKRGVLGAANDYAIEFANAVASLPKAALDIVKPGTEASAAIGRFIEEGEQKQSLAAAEAKFQLGRSMQSESLGEQAAGALRYVKENPLLAASQAVGSFVGPGAAIKGGKMIGGALGLTERGVARAGLAGGSTAGAVLAGGDAAGDAYQMVMEAPELQDMPIEERAELATRAARKATPLPFVIGAASGLVGADKAFAAGTKSILKTTLAEAGSEFVEEGATKLSANLAAGEMAPSIQPLTGVVGSATLGGLLGGGTGAVVGTLNRATAPNSLLGGSTNLSTGEGKTPDENAINKAIDLNSSEILVGPPPRETTIGPPTPTSEQVLQAEQVANRVAVENAQAQAAQQQAQQQAAFDEISSTYGVQPTQVAGRYTVAGKTLFSQADATKFLTDLDALNQEKTPEQKSLIGAVLSSGAVKVPLKSTAKSVNAAAVKFLSEWGIDSSADKAEAAERADVLINTLEGPKALKEADELNNFYKALTGRDAPAFVALQELASQTTTKGAKDGQKQLRVQSPAGIRAVSEQGGTTETGGGVTGDLRPDEVRPIGTGSNLILPSAVQNVGQGSVRTRVEPSTSRVSDAVPSARQEQEAQVIPDDRLAAIERVRDIVNSAFGTRDGNIVMEYLTGEKTSVQIADEYGVSDARIAQIAGPKAQETWGARIFAAAKRLGYTKDQVYNLLVVATAEPETTTETETLTEEDLDFEAAAAREAAVSDEAGPTMAEEAAMAAEGEQTLGREETGEREGGGASGFRVFNPQESGATELEDASAANRTYQKFKKQGLQALKDFELNNLAIDERITDAEIEAIVKEINRREEIRIAKGEDSAVQKRSTKRVPVREQAQAGQRVREEDTEGREAAAEAEQADEEVSARTLDEEAAQAWNTNAEKLGLFVYDALPEEAQQDWKDSVETGNTTPRDMQTVFENNQGAITEADEKLNEQIDELKTTELAALEEHYGNSRESNEFLVKVKNDVAAYINKGAQAVDAAIRSIIKSIANGMMALAVVFNPAQLTTTDFDFPLFVKETRAVTMPAPGVAEMSPVAAKAYEVSAPAFVKAKQTFFIADKPNGKIHLFDGSGKHIASSDSLYGQQAGDRLTDEQRTKPLTSMSSTDKVTPAGTFTLRVVESPEYDGGYTLHMYDKQGYLGGLAIHSVYVGDAKENRLGKLLSQDLKDKKISFGCINTSPDFFINKVLPRIGEMDNAGVVVIPDAQDTLAQYVEPTFTEVTTPAPKAEGRGAQQLAAKEEKVNFKRLIAANRRKEATEFLLENNITPEQAEYLVNFEFTTTFDGIDVGSVDPDIFNTFSAVKEAKAKLAAAGVENALNSFNGYVLFTDDKAEGIQTVITAENGDTQSIVGINASVLVDDTDVAAFTLTHEIAHAIDDPTFGGVYSGQPEFNIRVTPLGELPVSFMGPVMRELYTLYTNGDEDFQFLEYPFRSGEFDIDTFRGEVFAQAFAAMLDPQFRAMAKTKAPQTYSFMEDVFNDVKTTTFQAVTPEGREAQTIRRGAAFSDNRGQRLEVTRPVREEGREKISFSKGGNLYTARKKAAQQVAKLPKPIRGPLQEITDNIIEFAKKGLPFAAFTEDLADVAAKYIPSAKKYVQLVKGQQAIRTSLERRIDQILQQYDALPNEVKGVGENSVNAFIKDSTMKGEWGYDPNIKGAKVDPELKARFDAMPQAAQDLIRAVFDHGVKTLKAMQDAVISNINTEYDALIAAAQKANDATEVAELAKKKANSLTEYRTLMRMGSKAPYAPLKRFGNYVVVGRSQAYLDQENIRDNPKSTPDQVAEANKKLREMEKNQDHYFVQFAETMGEAKAIARDEETNYVLVEPFEKDSSRGALFGGSDVQGLFYRLRNMVEESQDSNTADKSERTINRLLSDLHLSLLSEQSARQSERRRRKIAGAEKDMMRAFATQGRATAHFISSLENSEEIYDALRDMKKEADARTPGRAERRRFYNEFMKRHVMNMDYEPSPFIDKALNTTSVWMLLTNPAYFVQNSTQPFMMSLPLVGAKHGYDKSWKEFSRAYSEVVSTIRKHGLGEDSYNKLPEDVRDVIEELVNRGRIDISLEQDLGRWRSTEDSKLNKFGVVTEKLRGLAQDIESINRVATAVAAYRLEARTNNKANAINYADNIIYRTHGDYSGFNAPRISRKGLGRLATQFRKFQLIQLSLMARLFNDAFAGQDEQIRQIARRALAFTIGHTAVVGGIMGLPGFTALAFLYGLVFGDEDEPDNPELAMRRAIGDDTIADLLVKGVPAALGVDVSGKLGMGQMLSILPYTDVEFSRKGIAQAGYALMTGPFGGLTLKAADGISLMGQGDYYKGLEQLMPTGVAQAMRGYRFATEGVTSRAGDVLISPDEISFLEGFMVAAGLPTKQLTDKQFLQSVKFDYDQFYNDKASEVKRAYVRAYKSGDGASLSEARQEWEKLQQSRVRNGYTRQPLSNLLKAPQEQAKRERETVGGVQTNKANRGFVRQTSEL